MGWTQVWNQWPEGKHKLKKQWTKVRKGVECRRKWRGAANGKLPIVNVKAYDFAEKTIHYIQVSRVIRKPKIKNVEAEENFKKAEISFKVDLETLIDKTSDDLKLL